MNTYDDATAQMDHLIRDLSPLEVHWTAYDHGRFGIIDGIQTTLRDRVIVITRDGDWLVGWYTHQQHAEGDAGYRHEYCADSNEVLLAIITEGQER